MDGKIRHAARRPGWILGGALVSVAVLAGVNGALAQSSEWEKIVAAANKEGIVVANVQPNLAMRKYWKTHWPKAYPKIKLSLNVVRGSVFVQRIQTERKAGKYLWDFGFSGGNTGYRLWRKGIIDPMQPEFVKPDIKDPKTWGGWDNIFYDKQKKYVMSVQYGLKPPFYNAKMIPPAKAKRMGIKLLLDPAYKGKIVWHDPRVRGSGRGFARLLRVQFGDKGLRDFIVNQKVVFVAVQNDVTDGIARGKFAIGLGPILTSLLAPYRKAGLDLDVRPLGNTPEVADLSTFGSTMIVYNRRPHPNATRVFVNWVLSREVQMGMSKVMLFESQRTDVPQISEPGRRPIRGAPYIFSGREAAQPAQRAAVNLVKKILAEK